MRRGWLEALNRPLDRGAALRGKRWLGDGKAWRGLVISVAGACLAAAIQVDTALGVWLLLRLWLRPKALVVIMSFAVALIVHPLVAWIGYRLGARDTLR